MVSVSGFAYARYGFMQVWFVYAPMSSSGTEYCTEYIEPGKLPMSPFIAILLRYVVDDYF